MTAFKPGDKVLLDAGAGVVGTIIDPTEIGIEHGYCLRSPSGAVRFANAEDLTTLPPETPLYAPGDAVQVANEAPHHAGQAATVSSPAHRGAIFGYWLRLDMRDSYAWIPAEALNPLHAGTPALDNGTTVRVSDNAEFYIGCTGTTAGPEVRNGTPGYQVRLTGTGILVWIPADKLTVFATDDGGPGD